MRRTRGGGSLCSALPCFEARLQSCMGQAGKKEQIVLSTFFELGVWCILNAARLGPFWKFYRTLLHTCSRNVYYVRCWSTADQDKQFQWGLCYVCIGFMGAYRKGRYLIQISLEMPFLITLCKRHHFQSPPEIIYSLVYFLVSFFFTLGCKLHKGRVFVYLVCFCNTRVALSDMVAIATFGYLNLN